MEGKNNDRAFGEIALEKGFVTQEQLDRALGIQAKEDMSEGGHRPIGRILLNEGLITLRQIGSVLRLLDKMFEYNDDITFGDIALEKGFITKDQLDKALKIQTYEYSSTGNRRAIGRILLNEGLITLQQIGEVLKTKDKKD